MEVAEAVEGVEAAAGVVAAVEAEAKFASTARVNRCPLLRHKLRQDPLP